jgi:hypothetical protein
LFDIAEEVITWHADGREAVKSTLTPQPRAIAVTIDKRPLQGPHAAVFRALLADVPQERIRSHRWAPGDVRDPAEALHQPAGAPTGRRLANRARR